MVVLPWCDGSRGSTVISFSVVALVGVGVTARCSLESIGRVSLRPPPVHCVCASGQAGKKCSRQPLRVARAQQHRPGGRLHCGRISAHPCFFGEVPGNQQDSQRRTTTASAAPAVVQLICCGSAASCGTRLRSASHGTSHWYSTLSLLFLFSRIFRGFFATFRPARCSRGTSAYLASFSRNSWNASGPRVLRHFGRARKSPGGSDAGISQNFLTSPAHGPGWPG